MITGVNSCLTQCGKRGCIQLPSKNPVCSVISLLLIFVSGDPCRFHASYISVTFHIGISITQMRLQSLWKPHCHRWLRRPKIFPPCLPEQEVPMTSCPSSPCGRAEACLFLDRAGFLWLYFGPRRSFYAGLAVKPPTLSECSA